MKRYVCLVLGLLMILCAGCGHEVEPPMVEHAQETAAAAATSMPAATPAAEKVSFSRGVWEENTYVSDYASLRMAFPDDWDYADALELEEMTERDENGNIFSMTDGWAQCFTMRGKTAVPLTAGMSISRAPYGARRLKITDLLPNFTPTGKEATRRFCPGRLLILVLRSSL